MGVKQRVNKVFVFYRIVNSLTNHDVFFKKHVTHYGWDSMVYCLRFHMVILVPEKLLMSKLLFMAATLVASNAVIATTVIDVNVMVPKSIVDRDGADKVFNTIHQRVAAMDEYYTSQRTGIVKNGNPENLHFEVKKILVMSDTVLNLTCKTV